MDVASDLFDLGIEFLVVDLRRLLVVGFFGIIIVGNKIVELIVFKFFVLGVAVQQVVLFR